MDNSSKDELLFNVLSESGQIVEFFHSVFGFLYRKTDFFNVREDRDGQFGFPPGVAEQLVLQVFKQWQSVAGDAELVERTSRLSSDGVAPTAVEELEIRCEESAENTDKTVSQAEGPVDDKGKNVEVASPAACNLPKRNVRKRGSRLGEPYAEGHNGAVREGYSWSQSISDMDVAVEVPSSITRGRQVRVEVTSESLGVWCDGREEPLVRGEFPWRTNKDEAVWSLVPGKLVQVHLEKREERWWESLFTSEPKIDLSRIDPSRPLNELSECDQMKVQKLVLNEERRARGAPPASGPALTTAEMLKKSWHLEGSPFKDMPYDPSIVTFGDGAPPALPPQDS